MAYKTRHKLLQKVPGSSSNHCPYCKKESKREKNIFWPFCSERCKLLDLGKWASGQYSIPGEPVSKEEAPDEGEEENKDDLD